MHKLRGLAAALGALVALTVVAPPAQALYTVNYGASSPINATFYYTKYAASPLNSTLVLWMTSGGNAYRLEAPSGSGDGTLGPGRDECATNHGWLPNGQYHSGVGATTTQFFYKTAGDPVIRGYVWYLGDKPCSGGTLRTELFIHSQGLSGWTNANYASNGCIKVNQDDRTGLAYMYSLADNNTTAAASTWVS
jgi:hypothetical protein